MSPYQVENLVGYELRGIDLGVHFAKSHATFEVIPTGVMIYAPWIQCSYTF
jgi:hypothetical protein